MFLRYSPRAQRLAIWDKFSFSLRIVPLIIHMNKISSPLTIVQINIFEEPKISFPNQNPRPQTIEPAPSVFLAIECPPQGCALTKKIIIYNYILFQKVSKIQKTTVQKKMFGPYACCKYICASPSYR